MRRTIRLIEKASIDWNNYLTPEEVQKLKSKNDVDKADIAGDIIDSKEFKDKLENFKKSGWTYEELVDNLLSFCWNGNLTESNHQDIIDKYIKENTNSIIGLKELAEKVKVYISTVGKKYNNAKYDYERNNYKEQQEFYREILAEINKRLNLTESDLYNMITLYHNTSNENAIKIATEGIIPGLRKDIYGKGSEAEGSGVWCSLVRGYGYGGATITFRISAEDSALEKENDIEYMVFKDIKPEEITDVDLMISTIPSNPLRRDSINSTVESDIPEAIERWGKDDLLKVFTENQDKFVKPYNLEQFKHLLDTGEKYCKGNIYN